MLVLAGLLVGHPAASATLEHDPIKSDHAAAIEAAAKPAVAAPGEGTNDPTWSDHVLKVLPDDGALAQAIANAAPGDVLRLAAGRHQGPILLTKPLTLEGEAGAEIDGGGTGRVIAIESSNVTLRGVTVRNSGIDLAQGDAGIYVSEAASGALIEDCRVEGNLIGIYLHGARDAMVRRNTVIGRYDLRTSELGNDIQLWNAPGSKIIDNDISFGRDGIFVDTSNHNLFQGNRMRNVRFAVHYMYVNDSQLIDNRSTGNDIAYAIMSSSNAVIRGNVADGDGEGLLFNYTNNSLIEDNVIRNAKGKCVFVYNTNVNRFHRNRFEGCGIGIHFTGGSERNRMWENAFIANKTQVMYVGTRSLDWSDNGRGNYWSDNPAFDLNGDGIADAPYRPNDIIDRVVWTYPSAKLLLNSPAVQVIRWAQSQFPSLHPGGVVDSAPLMTPPVMAGFP